MILYSKSGEFLGISREELSFLGYEDLEDFKSINDDVADLFVNRPGYIFKFKNFSWIDYALHSGAPKKSVILQLKTGNEVETNIKIKELFLNNPKENEDIYYSVEFTNSLVQNNPIQSNPSLQQIQPAVSAPQIVSPEPTEEKEEIVQPVQETKIPISSYDNDFKDDYEEKIPLNLDESFDDTIGFKKSDESLKIESNSQDDFMQDYKEETLKIDAKEDYKEIKLDTQEEDQQTALPEPIVTPDTLDDGITIKLKEDVDTVPIIQQDSNEDIDTLQTIQEDSKEDEEENFDFDILECVEQLGLDIGLVSELLTDYVEKLTQTLPLLKLNINTDDQVSLEENIYNLKGISDNLHVNQISNKLTDILQAIDKENKEIEVEKFEKIVTKFKGELI